MKLHKCERQCRKVSKEAAERTVVTIAQCIIFRLLYHAANKRLPKMDNLSFFNGGADGIRTHDLLNAIQALSQLSYSPTLANEKTGTTKHTKKR